MEEMELSLSSSSDSFLSYSHPPCVINLRFSYYFYFSSLLRMRAPSRFVLGMSCFLGGLVLGVTGVTIAAGALGSARFPDVPAGSYFDEAVGEMAELGIIRGRPDGRFDPAANVTRAAVAVMMKRLRDEILGIESSSTSSSSSRTPRSTSSSSRSSSSSSSSSSSTRSSSSASRNPAGSIRFTTSNYTVNENESPAKITMIRTGGGAGGG